MKKHTLTYTHNDTTLEAFYAYDPASSKPKPLVLIAHAWAGRDDFVCEQAKQLASSGYVGFALDMYGQGILGKNNDENAQLMTPFMQDRSLLLSRLQAGLNAAITLDCVNPNAIAAIGFCFGGLCVLDLARSGEAIAGVLSFHGLLQAPEAYQPTQINARVLALHGYDDPMATPDQLHTFCTEMTKAKADWQVHAYGKTQHAFTNPDVNDPELGTMYNPVADQRAQASMGLFLAECFETDSVSA